MIEKSSPPSHHQASYSPNRSPGPCTSARHPQLIVAPPATTTMWSSGAGIHGQRRRIRLAAERPRHGVRTRHSRRATRTRTRAIRLIENVAAHIAERVVHRIEALDRVRLRATRGDRRARGRRPRYGRAGRHSRSAAAVSVLPPNAPSRCARRGTVAVQLGARARPIRRNRERRPPPSHCQASCSRNRSPGRERLRPTRANRRARRRDHDVVKRACSSRSATRCPTCRRSTP